MQESSADLSRKLGFSCLAKLGEFHGQGRCCGESTSEEQDLSYEGRVRNHHGHKPEQRLQVVWKFHSSSVATSNGNQLRKQHNKYCKVLYTSRFNDAENPHFFLDKRSRSIYPLVPVRTQKIPKSLWDLIWLLYFSTWFLLL